MLRILRLIQGYVVFEASGGFTERFLNLCKINNINLWNVKNDGVKIVAFTTSKEFQWLDFPAKNSGMTIEIIKEKGLKTFVLRHKWRFGILIGGIAVCCFVLQMSGRIWSVETVAVSGVKSNDFTQRVYACGVKEGMKIKDIDYLAIEDELLFKYSDVRWVSVNIIGTKLCVEYTLLKVQSSLQDNEKIANLVASKAGLIKLVQCYQGTSIVKKDSFVPKGTLLISGTVKNGDLTETLVRAKGKVYAKTENFDEFGIATKLSSDVTENTESLYCINFFGMILPLGKLKKELSFCETEIKLNANGNSLPVGINRVDYISKTNSDITLTEKECGYIVLLESIKNKRKEYSAAELTAISYSILSNDKYVNLKRKIVCVENIAEERFFTTE